MLTTSEIAEKVKSVLADELKVSANELLPDKQIANDLGVDSLQMVELVMKLEEVFEIKIPDEEATGLVTVQDAINYVQKRLNNSGQG